MSAVWLVDGDIGELYENDVVPDLFTDECKWLRAHAYTYAVSQGWTILGEDDGALYVRTYPEYKHLPNPWADCNGAQ